jgi:peptidoglycan/xylan/chitin deacetylase (PgdA/CDA1 family)
MHVSMTKRQLRVLSAAAVVVLGLWAGAAALLGPASPVRVTVIVNGRRVELRRDHTVAAAVAAAGVVVHNGRLLSARSHRVLALDGFPPRLSVDGHQAQLSTRLDNNDRVDARSGADLVEGLVVRRVGAGGAGPGLPDVERTVWHAGLGADFVARLEGERSGELIAQIAGPIPARPDTSKVVELTFDDGPDPRWTPQVLSILDAERIHATFSLIGIWAAQYPNLVRQELAMGETVCNHTLHHNEHLDRDPLPIVAAEIDGGAAAIEAASGHDPSCYRPPGGRWSPMVVQVAHAAHERMLDYSIDPSDYLKPPPPVILSRILSKLTPGAVVVLHDGGGDRSHTVAMLKTLIDTLKAQGFTFTTLTDEPIAAPGVIPEWSQ